ncbi:S8 family serine peptidase [Streptomyces sp. KL116D]|uniref:S8 family serine peptidase n=1 Tax=Streptomyces sp. KL116D TaxID=3045152 RepID=UPI0035565FCF
MTVGVGLGVDDTHPDIAPNSTGRRRPAVWAACRCKDDAWRPVAGESDHGMHAAGTIAAAKRTASASVSRRA